MYTDSLQPPPRLLQKQKLESISLTLLSPTGDMSARQAGADPAVAPRDCHGSADFKELAAYYLSSMIKQGRNIYRDGATVQLLTPECDSMVMAIQFTGDELAQLVDATNDSITPSGSMPTVRDRDDDIAMCDHNSKEIYFFEDGNFSDGPYSATSSASESDSDASSLTYSDYCEPSFAHPLASFQPTPLEEDIHQSIDFEKSTLIDNDNINDDNEFGANEIEQHVEASEDATVRDQNDCISVSPPDHKSLFNKHPHSDNSEVQQAGSEGDQGKESTSEEGSPDGSYPSPSPDSSSGTDSSSVSNGGFIKSFAGPYYHGENDLGTHPQAGAPDYHSGNHLKSPASVLDMDYEAEHDDYRFQRAKLESLGGDYKELAHTTADHSLLQQRYEDGVIYIMIHFAFVFSFELLGVEPFDENWNLRPEYLAVFVAIARRATDNRCLNNQDEQTLNPDSFERCRDNCVFYMADYDETPVPLEYAERIVKLHNSKEYLHIDIEWIKVRADLPNDPFEFPFCALGREASQALLDYQTESNESTDQDSSLGHADENYLSASTSQDSSSDCTSEDTQPGDACGHLVNHVYLARLEYLHMQYGDLSDDWFECKVQIELALLKGLKSSLEFCGPDDEITSASGWGFGMAYGRPKESEVGNQLYIWDKILTRSDGAPWRAAKLLADKGILLGTNEFGFNQAHENAKYRFMEECEDPADVVKVFRLMNHGDDLERLVRAQFVMARLTRETLYDFNNEVAEHLWRQIPQPIVLSPDVRLVFEEFRRNQPLCRRDQVEFVLNWREDAGEHQHELLPHNLFSSCACGFIASETLRECQDTPQAGNPHEPIPSWARPHCDVYDIRIAPGRFNPKSDLSVTACLQQCHCHELETDNLWVLCGSNNISAEERVDELAKIIHYSDRPENYKSSAKVDYEAKSRNNEGFKPSQGPFPVGLAGIFAERRMGFSPAPIAQECPINNPLIGAGYGVNVPQARRPENLKSLASAVTDESVYKPLSSIERPVQGTNNPKPFIPNPQLRPNPMVLPVRCARNPSSLSTVKSESEFDCLLPQPIAPPLQQPRNPKSLSMVGDGYVGNLGPNTFPADRMENHQPPMAPNVPPPRAYVVEDENVYYVPYTAPGHHGEYVTYPVALPVHIHNSTVHTNPVNNSPVAVRMTTPDSPIFAPQKVLSDIFAPTPVTILN